MNPASAILKRVVPLIVAVLLADQVLKVWVKLNFRLGEFVHLFGTDQNWAYLQFVENRGMAFGLEFGGEMGKVALTLFRIVAVIGIGWLLRRAVQHRQGRWSETSLALVFTGALGNIIDSTFYGVLFGASTHYELAEFLPAGGGYASLLHGAVVDMFYFPLWQGELPTWLPFWGGRPFEFFQPVFNIADVAITVGIAMLLLAKNREAIANPHPPAEGPTTTVDQQP